MLGQVSWIRDYRSSDDPASVEVDTVVSKPFSSSQPQHSSLSQFKPFHALIQNCVLKEKHIRKFKKRFQFLVETKVHLPHPNEKACAFA